MANVQWKLDPAHSELQFKVKHLMISTVTGYFRSINLEVETETDKFTHPAGIRFTADVASVDTNNDQRDAHLKSADFFEAEKYPQIVFTGDRYEADGDEASLHGQLTIKEHSTPLTVKVEFGGVTVDGYGQTKAGFTVTGKISRSAFGLTWSAVTEAGSVVVGDEIKFTAEIQVIKQG